MFTGIRSKEVPIYWDSLAKLIEKPLQRTDAGKYYTANDVLWKCVNKEWQCWVALSDTDIDCVFITYVASFPTGYRSFVVYLVGGSQIDKWLLEAWTTLKEYARASKCSEINGMGRKGWLRALKKVESEPIEEHIRFSVEL